MYVLPTTITKNGGSRFVRIPPTVLKIMNISEGDELTISTDGKEIILRVGE